MENFQDSLDWIPEILTANSPNYETYSVLSHQKQEYSNQHRDKRIDLAHEIVPYQSEKIIFELL